MLFHANLRVGLPCTSRHTAPTMDFSLMFSTLPPSSLQYSPRISSSFFSLHWFTRQVARTCGGPQLYSHAEGGDDYLCKLGSHHSWNDTIVTILLSRHYRWIYILSFVSVHSIEQQKIKTDECENVQIVQESSPKNADHLLRQNTCLIDPINHYRVIVSRP